MFGVPPDWNPIGSDVYVGMLVMLFARESNVGTWFSAARRGSPSLHTPQGFHSRANTANQNCSSRKAGS